MRYGTVGRNTLRGPGLFNMDASLFRNFKLTERFGMQFRAEVFNVLNSVNLGLPITTLNAGANFGRITSAASPRIVQFGLKYLF